MSGSRFRVLETAATEVKLVPIDSERSDSIGEQPVVVNTEDCDGDIFQVVSVLEPGHLISAEIDSSVEDRQFRSIRHLGGFSLVELPPFSIPQAVSEYANFVTESGGSLEGVFRSLIDGAGKEVQNVGDAIGEMVVCFPGEKHPAWDALREGQEAESIYGEFHELDGAPAEVFIGRSPGSDYCYAVLFREERSTLARQIRATQGFLYDDQFVRSPYWDGSALVDEALLPEDIEANLGELIDHNIAVRNLPSRFGRQSIELITEFLTVCSQFELVSRDMGELEFERARSYTAAEFREATPTLWGSYRFYRTLLTEISNVSQSNPGGSIHELQEQGKVPAPELLYRSKQAFEIEVSRYQAYFDKMEQVPLEKYLVDSFAGSPPVSRRELRDKYGTEGLPMLFRAVLHDSAFVLDEMKDLLKVSDYVVRAIKEDDEYRYDAPMKEKAIRFATQHEQRMRKHLIPMDMGGEDPAIFTFLLGRLQKRYPWLDSSALGPGGTIMNELGNQLRDAE